MKSFESRCCLLLTVAVTGFLIAPAPVSARSMASGFTISKSKFQSPGNIHGLVAAVYSPFHALNLSLNTAPEEISAQASYLNETGVSVAFVCGTTGESVDLTVPERMELAAAWVEPCKRYGLKLMVHVGTDSVMDARRLAEHAQKIGAWGIAAMPPTYIKPSSVEMLVKTMDFVASGAPSLPFYYYHIPSMTGVDMKMNEFISTVNSGNYIPNLNGIKFTDTDLADLLACVKSNIHGRQPNMLYGLDAQLLSALIVGVHGAVGSSYNFNGVLEGKVIKAFNEGNFAAAAEAQYQVGTCLENIYGAVPGVNGGKALMNLIGKARGGRLHVGPPRLPQHTPTEVEVQQVLDAAQKWCKSSNMAAPWCTDIKKGERKM